MTARLNMLQLSVDKPDLLKRCFTSSLHQPTTQPRLVMKVSVLLSLCDPSWKSHQFRGCISGKITFNTVKKHHISYPLASHLAWKLQQPGHWHELLVLWQKYTSTASQGLSTEHITTMHAARATQISARRKQTHPLWLTFF